MIDLTQSQSSDESVSMFDYGDNEDVHGFDERYELCFASQFSIIKALCSAN